MDGMSHAGDHRRSPGNLRFWVAAIASTSLLWLVLVGSSVNTHEMWVGSVCALATILVVARVAQAMRVRVRLRWKDLAQGLWIPWYMAVGVAEVTLVLAKDLLRIAPAQNLFRVCGFESSKNDPVLRGRTVLAVAFTTMSPNFIVLGVDMDRSRMLFHQIKRSEVPRMTKALGARA